MKCRAELKKACAAAEVMDIHRLQEIVHQTRDVRRKQTIPKYSPAERDTLIKKYHPDFRESAYRPIKFGPNAGEMTVRELAALLEGDSPVPPISTSSRITRRMFWWWAAAGPAVPRRCMPTPQGAV